MQYSIRAMNADDCRPVMDIFNHYIEHSFAAYREQRMSDKGFDIFLEAARGYPSGIVRDDKGQVLGFGMMRAHKPAPEFFYAAEITYFLHPDYRGMGIGTALLQSLEKQGRELGITTVLAHISSRNPESLNFHSKNGFIECGRFMQVGRKNGQKFDVVWMQKML
jgi:phosphinothricin acetyltransferase